MAADDNISVRARVGGSGLTLYRWDIGPGGSNSGQSFFSLCRQVSHQAPTAVGQGVVPIHPMDRQYPVQLVTPQAQGMGSLTLEFYEPVERPFWQNIPDLKDTADLVDIFIKIASHYGPNQAGLSVSKYILDPAKNSREKIGGAAGDNSNPIHADFGQTAAARTVTYHSCVISAIDDSENVDVTTMEVTKRLTVNYTHWSVDNTFTGGPTT